jgi:hypothetical protein
MQTSRSGVRARNLVTRFAGLLLMTLLTVMAAGVTRADAQQPTAVPCTGGDVPTKAANSGGPQNVPSQPDLVVTGTCYVRPGAANKYYYNNVNILANGKLIFTETHADNTTPGDEQTDFWVASIIVEGDGTATAPNGGAMMAGTEAAPYGSAGNHTGTLTIHLFGADQSKGNPFPPPPAGNGPGQGVLCKSAQTQNKTGPCGIPWDRWVDNGNTVFTDLPGGVKDYFYQYGPLMGDSLGTQFSASPYTPSTQGYFGYKVLAVSYGGSLQLFGYKGTPATGATPVNTSSANSWISLCPRRQVAEGRPDRRFHHRLSARPLRTADDHQRQRHDRQLHARDEMGAQGNPLHAPCSLQPVHSTQPRLRPDDQRRGGSGIRRAAQPQHSHRLGGRQGDRCSGQ